MVVMRCKHIAAVVFLAVNLRNDVEKLIVFQKLVVDIQLHSLNAFNSLRGDPNDRFTHHAAAVSLVKLDRRRPCLDKSANRRIFFMQRSEFRMVIHKPEVAHHQTAVVFRFRKVGIHLLCIEIQGIDVINSKLAMYARRIFSHREVNARSELLAVGPHLHVTAESVDVDSERLANDLIYTDVLKLLLKILSCQGYAVTGISPALIFLGAQLFDDLFVMFQIRSFRRRCTCHQH